VVKPVSIQIKTSTLGHGGQRVCRSMTRVMRLYVAHAPTCRPIANTREPAASTGTLTEYAPERATEERRERAAANMVEERGEDEDSKVVTRQSTFQESARQNYGTCRESRASEASPVFADPGSGSFGTHTNTTSVGVSAQRKVQVPPGLLLRLYTLHAPRL
jgi:cell division protein FtsN